MIHKVIYVDPAGCTGCRDCETACSLRHAGMRKSARTRIQVVGAGEDGFHLPTVCQQCVDPPCMAVCPSGAIRRDRQMERVVIDKELCIGCKMCVSACPMGAMGFDPDLGRAYKCDLCDGDPQCVKACRTGALAYTEDHTLHHHRIHESACKLYSVVRMQAA
ncbi:MAG: 4Fe-4S dicluster domain-containing protein [Deltaproteobacteria bacterium]|nr:4Fe-4S dicluster domain-containing protein [Deltaproteobacteria bacterium]